MAIVTLKNINPLGYVNIPSIGRVGLATEVDENGKPVEGQGCLKPGEVFEVDAAIAGKAPFWRKATDDDAEAIARGHVAWRETEGDNPTTEVLDLGSGLLAQVGNYELVPKKKG